MAKSDWLPAREDEMLPWFNTFNTKLPTYAVTPDLSAGDLSTVVDDSAMVKFAVEGVVIFKAEQKEWVDFRNLELYGPPDRPTFEYADWAIDHAAELGGVDAVNARDLFLAAYPFHPAVLSVFERKWQSLPRFQRTRGIPRLLAIRVTHAFQKEHQRAGSKGDHLIGLGSAPVENLDAIRDRIDRFHAMNTFGDSDAASKLSQLKQQVAGMTGPWTPWAVARGPGLHSASAAISPPGR